MEKTITTTGELWAAVADMSSPYQQYLEAQAQFDSLQEDVTHGEFQTVATAWLDEGPTR